jgi:hypothetical protein
MGCGIRMARRLPWYGRLALAVLAGTLLVGCARPLYQRVQGTWRQEGGGWSLTLLKDGTLSGRFGPVEIAGEYSTPDEKHLRFVPGGAVGALTGPQLWPAEVRNKQLLLTVSGRQVVFTRVE